MALPPNQSNSLQSTMRSREIQQYQEFSMKEAIKTATKAGLFTAVSNQIANSTVLRRIPGMASVREGMELKKRELYERTGRDESGRKLTKRELEDRELRRKDAGALASIWELLDQDWRNGVPVVIKGMESAAFAMMSGFGSNAAGGERFRPISREYGRSDNVTIAPSEEGAYDIQDESSERLQRREEAAEQERADDADQDRDQEQEEGFFTKLFSKTFGSRDRSKSGGLIDSLLGIVGPLLGIFGGGGGIIGMLSGIVAPLMGVLATAGTAIVGFITPLLPVIIGGILIGAAGLLIKNWIDGLIGDMKNPSENTGVVRAYTFTDASGKKSIKTAADLGTTDEEIASGRFSQLGLNPNAFFVKTKDGKPTNELTTPIGGDRRSPEQISKGIAAYRDLIGERITMGGLQSIGSLDSEIKRLQESIQAGGSSTSGGRSMRSALQSKFYALDTMMYSFADEMIKAGEAIESDDGLKQSLVGKWNAIRDLAQSTIKGFENNPAMKNLILKNLQLMSLQYAPFRGLIEAGKDGNLNITGQQAYIDSTNQKKSVLIPFIQGKYTHERLQSFAYDFPNDPLTRGLLDKFGLVNKPTVLPDTFTGEQVGEFRNRQKVNGIVDPLFPLIDYENMGIKNRSPIEANPFRGKGTMLDQLSASLNNNAVGGGGGQAPVIINNNSPTSNVMSSTTARTPTGIDLAQMFNGARLATI